MIKQQVYINGVPTMVLQSDLTRSVIGKDELGNDILGDFYKHYLEDMTPNLVLIESLNNKESLNKQIQEAKTYLSETSWIWEKYSRNVTVLGDLTNEEFKLKYADIITKQEEARLLINSLELHLENINGI